MKTLRISICRSDTNFEVEFTDHTSLKSLRQAYPEAGFQPLRIITRHSLAASAIDALAGTDLGSESLGRTLESIMTEIFTLGVEYGRRHPKTTDSK